jgi:uncharacterized protein YbgA (DUF1722 family)/uncharacterized protein YbbK (DUF523 family)
MGLIAAQFTAHSDMKSFLAGKPMNEKIKIGISACLLGQNVRYDGGHSRDPFLAETLAEYVDFTPVCPEVEFGFPVPRETLRLVGDPNSPRLMTAYTKIDHTDAMLEWADGKPAGPDNLDLWGFIFKTKSPSCGMRDVKVYDEKGVSTPRGVGVFAAAFMKRFALLPVEDEAGLHDPALRDNFIESIFTLKRWRDLVKQRPEPEDFIQFHSRHKLLFMAHSVSNLRSMGKMVSEINNCAITLFQAQFQDLLLKTLKIKPTVGKHVKALMHALGYFKKLLLPDEKREILEIVESYKLGRAPLIAPIILMNHYVRKYEILFLKDQYYFKPDPIEWRLRNHA